MAASTASDLLVDSLIDWGVEVIFGIPGDGINGIIEALRKKQEEIRFIQVRHEEAAPGSPSWLLPGCSSTISCIHSPSRMSNSTSYSQMWPFIIAASWGRAMFRTLSSLPAEPRFPIAGSRTSPCLSICSPKRLRQRLARSAMCLSMCRA